MVTDVSGEARFPLPAMQWSKLYFQALALSQNAGYRPGSFTNVLEL